MTPLIELSIVAQTFFNLWAFLLCVWAIIGMVHSVNQRNFLGCFFALVLFVPSFYLWQVEQEVRIAVRLKSVMPLNLRILTLPYTFVLGGLLLMTVMAAGSFLYAMKKAETSISPRVIKLCVDRMPCGVCYWEADGRVIFLNTCMNRLCNELTNESLLNGNRFHEAIFENELPDDLKEVAALLQASENGESEENILVIKDRVWQFTCRAIVMDEEALREMIASDITEIYAKTKALQKDKARLVQLNEELRQYDLNIDETVRRQEILQAKVHIHDEMNHLMLSTMATDCHDEAALDKIFVQWERNALLLNQEAQCSKIENERERFTALGEALGLEIIWEDDGKVTFDSRQRALLFAAAREAAANAVKHAGAKRFTVSFSETPKTISCHFTNDGVMPKGSVVFKGGLANLKTLAAEQKAEVAVRVVENFVLDVTFPKGIN
ncbi:MAG: hypothetical protein Q4B73_06850 [Lachnospiraceae bacterium]|nr:hypothetical protein [Lachnospiraceae bacterium]